MTCVFCDHDLKGAAARRAFDPWLGRLWRVCPSCGRWNVVPLEERWETMESLERQARDRGRTLLRSEHLDLVDLGREHILRVGRAPRPELAGWRYGDLLPPAPRGGVLSWLRRLILALPSSAFGYNAGHGVGLFEAASADRWFASPFVDEAATLTAAFLHIPLAERCPSCGGPLAVAPWAFQSLRLTGEAGQPAVVSTCALCDREVAVPARDARAALRLGLSIVNRKATERPLVEEAARQIDRAEGAEGLLVRLSGREPALGELPLADRVALGIALDEQSEAELLEAEWREAEELASIVDGELTRVDGFDEFRRRVLS